MDFANSLKRLQPYFAWAPPWVFTLVAMAIALVAALIVHALLSNVVRRSLRGRDKFWGPLLLRTRSPTRWAMVILALSAALAASPLAGPQTAFVQHVFAIVFIAMLGWMALIAVDVAAALILRRHRVDVADNLTARKHLTQIRILQRAASVVVVIVTIALALMTINQVRQWGVSLLAAGGAAGIIVGLALQPLLTNLLAGLQIAATQPIRLDDQIVVENEVGNVEEINSTYVVVKLWDERRMVLPLTYFLQKPFQNWTRETAAQTGAVMLFVAYDTPIEPLRQRLTEVLKASPLWDGRIDILQVTEARENFVEVRCLMSASTAGRLFDLRCAVREAMIRGLRAEANPGVAIAPPPGWTAPAGAAGAGAPGPTPRPQ